MSQTRASRWNFPKEVWQRVAYWVPRMKDQPHWHAWTELRGLNHAFKSTIEDYYLDHYVKRTEIHEKRIALFTDDDAERFSEKDNETRSGWLIQANRATDDPGFNEHTIVTVRHELTDLLPIDLKIDYKPGKCTYKFDWRTYYSTYFDEERAKAAIYESKKPEFDAAAARISQQLHAGQLSMQDVLEQAFKIIAPYAAEGAEGLFVPVRRKRRLRIGLKHPQNKEWLENAGDEARKMVAESDEDVVLQHIKSMRQGLSFVDFSDSEDGEENDDQTEPDEDDDETDEWEDEDDEEEDDRT